VHEWGLYELDILRVSSVVRWCTPHPSRASRIARTFLARRQSSRASSPSSSCSNTLLYSPTFETSRSSPGASTPPRGPLVNDPHPPWQPNLIDSLLIYTSLSVPPNSSHTEHMPPSSRQFRVEAYQPCRASSAIGHIRALAHCGLLDIHAQVSRFLTPVVPTRVAS